VAFAKHGVEVEYFNVQVDQAALKAFLGLSGGERRVPLIVEEGRVTVGYEGS